MVGYGVRVLAHHIISKTVLVSTFRMYVQLSSFGHTSTFRMAGFLIHSSCHSPFRRKTALPWAGRLLVCLCSNRHFPPLFQ